MSDRLKSLVSGRRQIECEPPEVSFIVPFILRYEEDSSARAALAAIRRRSERLLKNERAWLAEHSPEALSPPQ
jgi:hypothetical protein